MTAVDIVFNALITEAKLNVRKPRHADLSQLGEVRARLPQAGHLLIPRMITSGVMGAELSEALGFARDDKSPRVLVVHFADTSLPFGGDAGISAIRKSITPRSEPEEKDILESKVYQVSVADAERKRATNISIVQSYLSKLNWSSSVTKSDFAAIVDTGSITEDGDEGTRLDWKVLSAGVQRFFPNLQAIQGSLPGDVRAALDQWLFVELYKADNPGFRTTHCHDVARDITRTMILTAARSPDEKVMKVLSEGEASLFTKAKIYIVRFGEGEEDKARTFSRAPADLKDAKSGVEEVTGPDATGLAEMMYFAMARQQLQTGTTDVKDMFAEVRVTGLRFSLHGESTESMVTDTVVQALCDADMMRGWTRFCLGPERAEVILSGAVISFLECGHHCTAQNLAAKMESIARAISLNVPKSTWETFLVPGCWAATHPFSIMLMLARMLGQAATGNLTFAVARRLNKNAPGTGPFIMLGEVLDTLFEAGFFHAVNRVDDYKRAKVCVAKIKENNHLKAPYSRYLYGDSRPEDTEEKAFLTRLASIASSLKDAMPNSTIASSEAFKRLTSTAAANSIVAGLQVRAFIRAVGTSTERTITNRLTDVRRGRTMVAQDGE